MPNRRPARDGDMGKKTLIGVLTTIALAFSAWLALGQINLTERMRAVEVSHESIQRSLDHIEDKIDQVILERTHERTAK